jgi:hypothetical protein
LDAETLRRGLNFSLTTAWGRSICWVIKRAAGRVKNLEAVAELEALRDERGA